MNTQQLNGGQIGNSTASPNKFMSAAVGVLVSTFAVMNVMSGTAGQASVTSIANMSVIMAMASSQRVSVTGNTVIGKLVYMVASGHMAATGLAKMTIARLQAMASTVIVACQGIASLLRLRGFEAKETIKVESSGLMGLQISLNAEQDILVTSQGDLSTFSNFAPASRSMRVLSDRRYMEVME